LQSIHAMLLPRVNMDHNVQAAQHRVLSTFHLLSDLSEVWNIYYLINQNYIYISTIKSESLCKVSAESPRRAVGGKK
jgi:hypothetical protein